MKKKLTVSLLCIALMLFVNVFAQGGVKIVVNGKEVKTDVECYIKNGRTMVPVRFIAEELGAEVHYGKDEEHNFSYVNVSAPDDQLALSMTVGYPVATISEGTYRSDVAPEIKDGRTMVPLRFIADYLNLDVKWDGETNTVNLTSKKLGPNEDRYKNFEKYFDDKAAEKYSKWLTSKNHSNEQFFEALK